MLRRFEAQPHRQLAQRLWEEDGRLCKGTMPPGWFDETLCKPARRRWSFDQPPRFK
jgi:hypothetical protein